MKYHPLTDIVSKLVSAGEIDKRVRPLQEKFGEILKYTPHSALCEKLVKTAEEHHKGE